MAVRVFMTALVELTAVCLTEGAVTAMLVKFMLAVDLPLLSVASEVTVTNRVLEAQFI